MKKKNIIIIITIIVIVLSLIANYYDSARVRAGYEPKLVLKTYSEKYDAVIYYGPLYKVVRHVAVSPNEPYDSALSVKMGSWLMSNNLSKIPSITALNLDENEIAEVVEIQNIKDALSLSNILENQKYMDETCDSTNDYSITVDKERYYLRVDCLGIVLNGKQATVSKEEMDDIIKIITKK